MINTGREERTEESSKRAWETLPSFPGRAAYIHMDEYKRGSRKTSPKASGLNMEPAEVYQAYVISKAGLCCWESFALVMLVVIVLKWFWQ